MKAASANRNPKKKPRPEKQDVRRALPSVDQVLQDPEASALIERHGRPVVARALRALLGAARAAAGGMGDPKAIAALQPSPIPALKAALEASGAASLLRVINATGIVVHTNLGRAPLSREAARRVATIASNYSNLEYDLAKGERGNRESHVEARLAALFATESSVVVNNCAAAVLLAVNSFAEGREVLVSRGELVEIGGSFRIPEILAKGGARLREVGTTNRTRLADYQGALGPETGMVLKVHRSNFEVLGFTEETERGALAGLCREAGIPLVEDLGSGLVEAPHPLLAGEPTVAACLAGGVDLVAFSGDKLLGGPQAGIVAGRRARVDAMRKNPLYRALRVDKLALAGLDVVLADHDAGRASERVPVLRMLAMGEGELRSRAQAIAAALASARPDFTVGLAPGHSAVGGGAAPTVELPTVLVTIAHASVKPDALARALRAAEPPVIARVSEGRVVLDPRTIAPAEDAELVEAFRRAAPLA